MLRGLGLGVGVRVGARVGVRVGVRVRVRVGVWVRGRFVLPLLRAPTLTLRQVRACRGETDYYVGAGALEGLKAVATIEAMYRSSPSLSPSPRPSPRPRPRPCTALALALSPALALGLGLGLGHVPL